MRLNFRFVSAGADSPPSLQDAGQCVGKCRHDGEHEAMTAFYLTDCPTRLFARIGRALLPGLAAIPHRHTLGGPTRGATRAQNTDSAQKNDRANRGGQRREREAMADTISEETSSGARWSFLEPTSSPVSRRKGGRGVGPVSLLPDAPSRRSTPSSPPPGPGPGPLRRPVHWIAGLSPTAAGPHPGPPAPVRLGRGALRDPPDDPLRHRPRMVAPYGSSPMPSTR